MPDHQLRRVATKLGIEFAGGNKSVQDYPDILARYQFIYLLLIYAAKEDLLELCQRASDRQNGTSQIMKSS